MTMILHFIFLAVLGFTVFFFLCHRIKGKPWIGLFFGILFLALLVHQLFWQLHGGANSDFNRFRKFYDRREFGPTGQLLDRHGTPLLPATAATFHVLGYSHHRGMTGLEKIFAARLVGTVLPSKLEEMLTRVPPENITLTLDAKLQSLAYRALKGQRGAVVALDPRTGEILALVSSPSVDPKAMGNALKDTERQPLFNRATQGLYPPGSVFKIFTAALAIEQRQTQARICPAQGWRPARGTPPIRDTHPHKGDPALNLSTAFAESSNIWFAKAAVDCKWDAFWKAFQRQGLHEGHVLARHLDKSYGSARGRLPSLAGKNAALAYPGFGQGDLLLTPLHVAMLTATIANGGLLRPPHLEKTTPPPAQRIWPKVVAENVAELMSHSVQKGTSRNVHISGLNICGKTGTAENHTGADHAWFTCFAPKKNPKIVLTVLVEQGGYGATSALPIAKKMLEAYFKK